jgi:molybdopterin-binding protein
VGERAKGHTRKVPRMLAVRVESGHSVPVHVQLEHQLRSAVADGSLQPGEPLASIRDTARQLGVSANTVARAYANLAREGVIVARSGGGSVVAPLEQLNQPDLARRRQEQAQALADELVVGSLALGLEPADMLEAVGRTFAARGRPASAKPARAVSAADEASLLSARNRLRGTVTDIRGGETIAEVTLRLADGAEAVAVVTRQSLAKLGLHVGAQAVALAKATEVTLSR